MCRDRSTKAIVLLSPKCWTFYNLYHCTLLSLFHAKNKNLFKFLSRISSLSQIEIDEIYVLFAKSRSVFHCVHVYGPPQSRYITYIHVFHYLQCFLTYFPIQTAWSKEGWVEGIRAVGCHYDFHLGGEGRD